jgi:formamidopyrimidine-DNA glycosylase
VVAAPRRAVARTSTDFCGKAANLLMCRRLAEPSAPGYDPAMPELPDVILYIEHLERRLSGARPLGIRILSPHLLRTVDPAPGDLIGVPVTGLSRMGKRVVFAFEGGLFMVIHLMIAGRFQWREGDARSAGRGAVAVFTFDRGTLLLTEAGSRRRTSLHVLRGAAAVAALDPGGLEPLTASLEAFAAALRRERHTLKRALTDPRLFSGIGNAYSDEILHRARLSPLRQTHQVADDEVGRLYEATRATLAGWTDRLREEAGEAFPRKVTAFREGMAVHGRYREPCPACASPVQRIRYAANEANYCATCQTGGRVFADRALSRLLKEDWPRSLEEWDTHLASRREGGEGSSPP